ncbi:DNA methyltransferase [Natronorubrum halophilum]|uniref:DNA methyltransferase n=1 Tax=Natronorubrum halophilum TaxID=1702106 RepID=UPI0010C1C699|nr:DNA methyltransferase [Natronorubrum halophilum]
MKLEDLPTPERHETVSPDDLQVDGENPNEQSDEMFGLLCDNLTEKGWIGNAIVANTGGLPGFEGDPEGLIADGEHRWRAAQEVDLEAVPVKFYDFEDDAERRLWRQELNKISGEHDTTRDALEYDYLLNNGKSDEISALAEASGEDLDALLAEIRDDRSAGIAYEYDVDHQVYFEDCVAGMAERLEGDSVDLAVTDPPYGIDLDLSETLGSRSVKHGGTVANDDLEGALSVFSDAVAELRRVLKSDGHAYIFASWKTYDLFRDILVDEGFDVRNCIVWCKTVPNNQPNFGTGGTNWGLQHELILYATLDSPRPLEHTRPDIIVHKHSTKGNEHPTQKPVGLLEELIEQSSDAGDVVLDPFAGSASTAVASIRTDRECIGFELEEDVYREVVDRRISEALRAKEAATAGTTEDGGGGDNE